MSLSEAFPHLTGEGFVETSPATRRYNCIAWAAGATDAWWWPSPDTVHFWPATAPREETIEAFVSAFATLGFVPADDGAFNEKFEKVAFYAKGGKPTHAARQQSDGKWTSKLGKHIDITHTLHGLEGPVYGDVVGFVKRPWPVIEPSNSEPPYRALVTGERET